MQKAGRFHAVRSAVVVAMVVLLGFAGYESHGRLQSHALRDRLLDANTTELPTIVQDISSYRRWINPLLRDAAAEAEASKDVRKQLHASLALLPVDATQVDYLFGRMLDAEPHEVPVIRDALVPHKDDLLDKLWAVVEKPEKGKESQRLRAASALVKYDAENERWATVQDAVADDLVKVPAVYLAAWLESLRPVRAKLRTPLAAIFREVGRRDVERSLATDILADYAADQPQVLADLVMDADEKQFAVIFPKFKEQGERSVTVLLDEIDKQPVAVKGKMIFESKGRIVEGDAKVKTQSGVLLAKRFEVRLQGGKSYRLTMDSQELDSFLVLQDKTGKELAFDDDSGGNLNSLLVFTPSGDDNYTVFAASFKGTGSFVLNVVETIAGDGGKEKLAKRQQFPVGDDRSMFLG
jgi:hypothetical protein